MAVLLIFSATSVFGDESARSKTVAGLKSQVVIRRDARGIPFIEAANDGDLYFAQGYATAADRLFQMDLLRRVALGETAEIFGNATLEEDKRWRRFNFKQIAQTSLQYLSPELRAALQNYANGVNAYVDGLDPDSLPMEFKILQYSPRHWSPTDTIAIGKILADALSTTWRMDLLTASLQKLPADKLADLMDQRTPYDVILFGRDQGAKTIGKARLETPIYESFLEATNSEDSLRADSLRKAGLYANELAASNNWVISGKLTADGLPILANDPHLAPAVPGIWYLTHLATTSMRVSGVTFPGVPGIVLGHNENIAWGATNVGPDVQDLYIETFDEKGQYKTPNGWAMPTSRKEEIRVRANPTKPDTNTVTLDVTETTNGPVISESDGKRLSLRWTALDPKNAEFEAFFRLNRASSWKDFTEALKQYGGAAQNFVYADVKGNIGWYAAGRIPIRRTGDGSLPYDGSTNAGDWVGYIPFDELPHLYNPPNGLIVTANQRTVGTDYKYSQFTRAAASPWRARRILNVLSERPKLKVDNVRDVQYDTFSIPLKALADEIVRINGASPETLADFKTWNGRMDPESRGALLANEIRNCMSRRIAAANSPLPEYFARERIVDRAFREKLARWLPTEFENYGEFAGTCDSEVRQNLSTNKLYGPDDSNWLWGKYWTARFQHPLSSVPFVGAQFSIPAVPLSGSPYTPNVGSNVSMRFIATPGNWDKTRHLIPLGESGDPRSPNFKDQFDTWRTGIEMPMFAFSERAVTSNAKDTLTLNPQ